LKIYYITLKNLRGCIQIITQNVSNLKLFPELKLFYYHNMYYILRHIRENMNN
jgi:hypothetical protein